MKGCYAVPTYNPSLKNIDLNETRRYAGLVRYTNFPEQLLQEACTEAHILSQPKSSWNIYGYDSATATIFAAEPLSLIGTKVMHHLTGAAQVAVLAVTIGAALEQAVSQHFSSGNYTAGMLLDAAGTTAVESATDQAVAFIAHQSTRLGYTTNWRFSPGYGDWDISVQPHILQLAEASQINITVTNTYMLLPRKSVTAIIGLFPYQPELNLLPVHQQEIPCDQCIQQHCHARKERN
jgi:hypothetical protein